MSRIEVCCQTSSIILTVTKSTSRMKRIIIKTTGNLDKTFSATELYYYRQKEFNLNPFLFRGIQKLFGTRYMIQKCNVMEKISV